MATIKLELTGIEHVEEINNLLLSNDISLMLQAFLLEALKTDQATKVIPPLDDWAIPTKS